MTLLAPMIPKRPARALTAMGRTWESRPSSVRRLTERPSDTLTHCMAYASRATRRRLPSLSVRAWRNARLVTRIPRAHLFYRCSLPDDHEGVPAVDFIADPLDHMDRADAAIAGDSGGYP